MTKQKRPAAAIEGGSQAGKTTAIRAILAGPIGSALTAVPEYTDHEDHRPPPTLPPDSPAAVMRALEYYLSLDARRVAVAGLTRPGNVLLLDRSYHTLLAHVYACDRLFGWSNFASAVDSVLAQRAYSTDLTVFIDMPGSHLASRLRGKRPGRPLAFLLLPTYRDAFRSYFVSTYIDPAPTLRWVSGADGRETVAQQIADSLHGLIRRGGIA